MMEQLVNFVIRPPRAEYTPAADLLGPIFSLKGHKYKRVDLQLVNARGHLLVCSHYVPWPLPEAKQPCVIYCHGNSGCRADANEAVVVLLPCNITVFTLDFSGSGLSQGDYVSLGWYERDDLDAVVSHLRAEGKTSNIGLWGRSMGAVTSLMFGARDPSVAGLVLDSPFSRLNDLMMELVDMYRIRVPKFTVKMAVQYMKRAIQKKAGFDIMELDTLTRAPQCFIPALFGHATSDAFILPHHSEDIFNAYAGDKNIIKFEGDHNSQRPQFYYDSISIFFYNVLKPPDLPGSSLTDFMDEEDVEADQLVDQATLYELLINSQGVIEEDVDDDEGDGGGGGGRGADGEARGTSTTTTTGGGDGGGGRGEGGAHTRKSGHRRWRMSRTEMPDVNGDAEDEGDDDVDLRQLLLSSVPPLTESPPHSTIIRTSTPSSAGPPSSLPPSLNMVRSGSSASASLQETPVSFAPLPISVDQEESMLREAIEASLKGFSIDEEGSTKADGRGGGGGRVDRGTESGLRAGTSENHRAPSPPRPPPPPTMAEAGVVRGESDGATGSVSGPGEAGDGASGERREEGFMTRAHASEMARKEDGDGMVGGDDRWRRKETDFRGKVAEKVLRNELGGLKARTPVKVRNESSMFNGRREGDEDGEAMELSRADGRDIGVSSGAGRGREWREDASINKPMRVKLKERGGDDGSSRGGGASQPRMERKMTSGGVIRHDGFREDGTGTREERELGRRRVMSDGIEWGNGQLMNVYRTSSGSGRVEPSGRGGRRLERVEDTGTWRMRETEEREGDVAGPRVDPAAVESDDRTVGRTRHDHAAAVEREGPASVSGKKERMKEDEEVGARVTGIFSAAGAVSIKKRAMEVMAAMVGRSASVKESHDKIETVDKGG